MNSTLDKKSKEEIYRQIAAQLLQEVLKEDLSTIGNRDRIFEIFKKISTQDDKENNNQNKNYLLVHTKLQNNLVNDQSFQNEDLVMEMLMKNNEKLYNEIYQKVKSEFFFDIELQKYGRTFNGVRKRWAYIIYPDTFGSCVQKKKGAGVVFKNKNFSLENMKNISIQPYAVNLKDYKSDKNKNPVRIAIEFIADATAKKSKISEIYLYFENMQNAKQIYDVLLLMRMNLLKKKNPQLTTAFGSLSQKIEAAHRFIIFKKIVDVKNQIKAKKIIAYEEAERLKKQEELQKNNANLLIGEGAMRPQQSGKYSLGTKFENLLLDFFKKEENLFTQFGSLAAFRNAKETLRKVFLNKLKTKLPDKYLYKTPAAYMQTVERFQEAGDIDKKVRFKIKRQSMEGVIVRSSGYHNKNSLGIDNQKISGRNLYSSSTVNSNNNFNNFSAQNLVNINDLAINTKNSVIYFGKDNSDKNCLSGEDILQINSVYLHLNEKGAYEENCVLINGPKIELDKYLKYKLNAQFLKENNLLSLNNLELIEPEYHGLRIEQCFPSKFNPLVIQIFHASVYIPRNYINYLERKNNEINSSPDSNKNLESVNDNFKQSSENFNLNLNDNKGKEYNRPVISNFKLTNPLIDFYFFVSFTINGKFYARTKLTKASVFENESLFLEFNNQILLNQTQISLIKNFQMKVAINLIPETCIEGGANPDINFKNTLKEELIVNKNNNLNSNNDLIFSEFKLENFIEHLRPHEIAYCFLDHQNLKSNQNEFILKNNFDENDSSVNYIVLNLVGNNMTLTDYNNTKFISKDYSVGQEVYYLVEYSKEDFDKVLRDPQISEELKERFYNVEFDYENNFILRPHLQDQKEFVESFASNSNNLTQQQSDLMLKIFKNAKYKYLPKCEVYESKENLGKSSNMYLNRKYIFENGISEKKLIYKLRKIQKYSLCKIIGIGVANSILLKDLFLGKIFTVNNLDLLTRKEQVQSEIKIKILNLNNNKDAASNPNKISSSNSANNSIKDYELAESFLFKHIQENPISVYDFSEIELKSASNAFNHYWSICLKFANKLEIDTFLFYLRDLRRKANFDFKSLSIATTPVSTKMLIESVRALKNQFQKLNVMLEKIEFKKNLKLTPGAHKLQISLYKGNQFRASGEAAEPDRKNRSILELLDDENSKNFKNSLLQINEIRKETEFFKASRKSKNQLPASYVFDSESLAKLNNQIDFNNLNNNNNAVIGYEYKLFEINAQPAIDKVFTLQTQFALNDNSILSMQDMFNFYCEADLSEVISGSSSADFIRLPLYSVSDKAIVGMIDFKYWLTPDSLKNLSREMQFNTLFNARFKNISEIGKLIKDQYGNLTPVGRLNPNLFKRKILRTIFGEANQDLNSLAERVANETNGEIRNKLLKILLNKGVLGYDYLVKNEADLTKKNMWKQLVPDKDFLGIKNLKKFYIKKRKRNFYSIYRIEEWRKFFKQTKNIRDSSNGKSKEVNFFEQKTAIIDMLSQRENLISAKKENSEKYLQIRKFIVMGVPENVRLIAWDCLLNTEYLCLITIERLQKQKNNGAAALGLSSKQEVFEFFLRNVMENKKFNINFSFIDNDMNYLYRNDGIAFNGNYRDTDLSENLLIEKNGYFDGDKINEKNTNLKKIKNICKAYFLWTDLNISTAITENKDKNPRKYIYFFGMLELIKTLLSVFKLDYVVFWLLIGLSQLIMQRHFENIINQLIKLNFPIEFFLSKIITSLFSTSFETDFFLRLMDIIIFDATIKTNEYDKLDYLRFICTIPLVLIKLNEEKILDCKSICELENIFDNLAKKTFDHEKFLEQVKSHEEKFYKMTSNLEQFFDINKSNSWDIKRRQISESLAAHFAPVEEENMNFLNKLKKLKFSFDDNFIENYEGLLSREFTTMRKLYSRKDYDTPGINHDEEFNDIISGNKFKIAVCITDFKYFSDDLKNLSNTLVANNNNNNIKNKSEILNDEIFYAYLKFTEEKLPPNYVFEPQANQYPVVLKGFLGSSPKYEIFHHESAESFPTFLNIFLYTKTGFFIGAYRYEIVSKELFKSTTLYSENTNKNSFSLLEIKIVKAYTNKVSKVDQDLSIFLFRPPRYLYNFKVENLIDETNYNEADPMKLKKYAEIFNKHFESEIIIKNEIEENTFVKEQLLLNNMALELNENLERNYLFFKKNLSVNENKSLFKSIVGKFINSNSTNNSSINNNSLISTPENNVQNNNAILPDTSVFSGLNIQVCKILDILLDNFDNFTNIGKDSDFWVRMGTNRSEKKGRPNDKFDLAESEFFSFRTLTKVKNLDNEVNYNNNIVNFNDNTQEIKKILKNWIGKNDTSFEEILYGLVLIDTYSITIYEKLYLIYQIGKMRNFALCSKDTLSLKKFKEMIYALYKRFMVNFNKSEIDIMIDYLLKKEEFACLGYALVHNKNEEKRIKDIINENAPEQKENFLSLLNIGKSEKICEDIKVHLQNYFNLLRNYYLMDKITLNYFNSIWDLFVAKVVKKLKIQPNEIKEKWKFDRITIDFASDNIRKIGRYDLSLMNKEAFKIETKDLSSRININPNQEGIKRVMEDLIVEDLNSLNLTNLDSDESENVSFDQFKDVFFNLPFISEFVRASSGFTEENFEGLNRKLYMVKVHLNVGNNSRFFSFSEEILPDDSLNNPNERKNISYNFMAESLYTTNSFQDIFERVSQKLKRTGDGILDNILPYFMANPNMIIISTNIENSEKFERMKFYDPLFSSNSIRKSLKKAVIINFKLDVNDDFSRFDRDFKVKEPGFMKLKYSEDCYEWRKCKIKTNANSQITAKLASESIWNKYDFKIGASDDAFKL